MCTVSNGWLVYGTCLLLHLPTVCAWTILCSPFLAAGAQLDRLIAVSGGGLAGALAPSSQSFICTSRLKHTGDEGLFWPQ